MRLLVVSQYYWPESFRITEVVQSLVEKGVEVDVLTGKPNYPEGAVFSGYRAGAARWSHGLEPRSTGCRCFRVACAAPGAWRLITCRSW